ncbi:class F sortase [Pseudarthrobacter sp. DSP2-3-2b1]|uniref:class F sortase n=1 Tax=Pseudarthrobacter sp. DSP2-3-2b1 TaxID=2804661 RepID=UPI003CF88143
MTDEQPVTGRTDAQEPCPKGAWSLRIGHARKALAAVLVCGVLAFLAFTILPMAGDAGQHNAPLEDPRPAASALALATVQAAPATPAAGTPQVPVFSGPPAAPPERLIYPAAEIDVPILPLEPATSGVVDQTIVPPATMDGYWLTPYGMPGADSRNTTYVVGHSWQDYEAPFNRLSTQAVAGDLLTVVTSAGAVQYRVDSVTTYEKSSLKDSPIWEITPGRLVLISCYTDDLWGTNVVVAASPAA